MEAETPLETEAKSKRREQSRGMSNRNKRNGGQKMTQQQTSWGLRILYCDVRQHRSDSCTLDFLTTRRRKLKGTVPDVARSGRPKRTCLSGAGTLYVTSLWELPVMRGANRKFAMSSTWVYPRTK